MGDAFIDYVSTNKENSVFEKYLGGASVNVAVHISRFGIPSYYLTKLGMNQDSSFIQKELNKENVRLDFAVSKANKEISSVYIHLDDYGDRHFYSYVNNTPDDVLKEKEITEQAFLHPSIFYCGSGTLFHEEAKRATEKAIILAKKNKMLVAFDANIRLKRWENDDVCRDVILGFLPSIDIVKMSEEELLFLMEANTIEEGLVKVEQFHIPLLFITRGENGAITYLGDERAVVEGEKVEAIDTTGAGDAFMATILSCIHRNGYPSTMDELKRYVQSANVMGAKVAMTIGALPTINDYQIGHK